MDYNEPEMIYEAATPSTKKKIKNRKEISNISSAEDSVYVDFSSLNGLTFAVFERKFISLCQEMKESYNTSALYIPLDVYASKYAKMNIGELVLRVRDNSILTNLFELITKKYNTLAKTIPDFLFIFISGNEWFAINTTSFGKDDIEQFVSNIKVLMNPHNIHNVTGTEKTVNPVEKTVNDKEVEKDLKDKAKEELADAIARVSKDTTNEDEAIDKMNTDAYITAIMRELEDSEYGKPKLTNARTNRLMKLNDEFVNSSVNGKSVKEMLEDDKKDIPTTSLKINSPNEEWQNMRFINFNKSYDIDEDIVAILNSFSEKEHPIAVRKIDVEDTSTSLDRINTYHVEMEDDRGKRFTLHIDIPIFINNRFLMLRGNEKIISGQLINLPCTKTDEDTVQLVSNYSKIFVYRYGSVGKSYPTADRLLKAIRKYKGNKLKITFGNNSKICSKYELPIDYVDLATEITSIETTDRIFYFNQDVYRNGKYIIDNKLGVPFAVMKNSNKDTIYWDAANYADETIAEHIGYLLRLDDPEFEEIYQAQKPATKHMYARAKIMSGFIPLIVVICNKISFNELLNRAKIDYRIETKRVKYNPDKEAVIRFNDAFLIYRLSYESSMLMNGLLDCDTEILNISDLNKKRTWIDMLDKFGGRILADGLENFSELFLDPITVEVCKECKIPTDYIDLLIYANNLLADTKYIKHTDITGNRYRTNEIIAGHLYKALATAYGEYLSQIRRGSVRAGFSIKRTAVIDDIMKNPVTSDLSSMTPLLELEANNSATFKGLSGMNADRAYSLDKRTYDPSMVNKLALSTGFSENVGINRQTTMDMEITGKRGYIKNTDPEDISLTKRLSATEAVTPFGSTRDDPIRTAMAYIQTAKHSMPVDHAAPLLVTNGADEAMAYMVSDTYSFRAKKDGFVKELVPDQYMIATYKDGTSDYISLKEEIKKNSDGGFFMTVKLDTDLKQDKKFKEGEVLAYDAKCFSNKVGEADGLAYNVGVLAKVAILATDEGFEDSASISEWLSTAMGTSVATQIPVSIGADSNVYNMVKIGDPIEEGDPLIIIQDVVGDKDAAILLHNITDSDFVSDLGRVKIKSKYTGVVQDIKIYRTCEIEKLSPSLQKIVREYEKDIAKKKKLYKDNNIPGVNTLDPDYALDRTGKLKNVGDGVLIEFYTKYIDYMGVGDKLTFQGANKGVIKYMIPEGKEPYTKFRPDEKIHGLCAARSFNARMVTSPIVSGALNKGLIELDKAVKKIMGLEAKPLEEIQ